MMFGITQQREYERLPWKGREAPCSHAANQVAKVKKISGEDSDQKRKTSSNLKSRNIEIKINAKCTSLWKTHVVDARG